MFRRLAGDAAIYGGSDLLFRLIAFAAFPIYAHLFSVADFGVMALLTTSASLVGVVAGLGMSSAVQRFYWDKETTREQRALLVSTGLLLVLGASCAVVLVCLAALFSAPTSIERYGITLGLATVALLTVIPEQLLQFALDALRLQFKPWMFALTSFVKNVGGVLIGLLLILGFSRGIDGVFWGAMAGCVLAMPVALLHIRSDLGRAPERDVAGQLLAYAYPLVFSGMAYWILGAMDRWLLAQWSDNEQVGLYSIAFKLASILLFVSGAFGQAWSPLAIRIRAEDSDYRRTYSRILTGWIFLVSALAFALGAFAFEALALLTPREYWVSAPAVAVLAAATAVFATTQLTAIGIALERRTRLLAAGAWLAALVNFALNYLLIERFGAIGAALATLGAYALLTGFYLYCSQRLHPIPLERCKLAYCLLGMIAGMALAALPQGAPWQPQAVVFKLALLAGFVALAGVFRIYDPALLRRLLLRRAPDQGFTRA